MKILFAIAAIILFTTFRVTAETTNDLSDAEIQGRALAQKILEQKPTEGFTNTGVLKIRDEKRNQNISFLSVKIIVSTTNWENAYEAIVTNNAGWTDGNNLKIVHTENQPTEYTWNNYSPKITSSRSDIGEIKWLGTKFICPFFHSDFWAVDLGLEFFHWPEQKILKKEVHRSRGCTVLESTNPNPGTNGYSRVVSWIDNETLGIVEAYAYDAQGKKLKDFYPKDFKRVDGQWQVQTLVMENVQTKSRSVLEFDVKNQ